MRWDERLCVCNTTLLATAVPTMVALMAALAAACNKACACICAGTCACAITTALVPEHVRHRPAHVVPIPLKRPAMLHIDGGGVVDASTDQRGQAQAGANPRARIGAERKPEQFARMQRDGEDNHGQRRKTDMGKLGTLRTWARNAGSRGHLFQGDVGGGSTCATARWRLLD